MNLNKKNNSKQNAAEKLNKFDEIYAKEVLNSIDNLQYKLFKKRFDPKKDTSIYGETNPCETFAETFAELNCNKKPSTFAKAMGIYLDRRLKSLKNIDKKQKNNKIKI